MIGGVYSSSFVLFSQSHVLRSYGVASYARTQNEKKKPPPPLTTTTTTTTMPSLFSFCSSRCFPSQFVSFLLFSSSALMMMILNEDEKEDEDDARDRTDDHHEASSSVFSSSSSSFSFSIRVVFVRIRISWWWWYHRKTEPQALQRYHHPIFLCQKCQKKMSRYKNLTFDNA